MSKKEEAGVEELSQTTSPPLYFAYSASVSMLFLSFSFLCDFFSGFFLLSAPFHCSHAQCQSFGQAWPSTAFPNWGRGSTTASLM